MKETTNFNNQQTGKVTISQVTIPTVHQPCLLACFLDSLLP